jgi:cell division protein FtsX
MNQAAQHLPAEEKHGVEVVVYIKNDLGEDQQDLVISALKQTNGIMAAEFSGMRKHLVLAKYDKEFMSSQDVLKSFNTLNLEAKLIGPI